jgi:23S rRNA (cytosine1962-C5)-methyltransferase
MSKPAEMAALPRLILARGHVQPIWAGHPWVFAQAVARWEGAAQAGDEVIVCDARGEPLGRALHSPGSAIVARLFTRDPACPIDGALFERRLRLALERRQRLDLPNAETTGLRLVHAEGDDLPGLVVDRMGDVLSVQWGSIGLVQREAEILDLLERLLEPRAIVDRTSVRSARQEGFTPTPGVRRGAAELSEFDFLERGLRFRVPLQLGQKTGFYFDQRPLRARVEQLSAGKRVLDAYCYTGSLALSAARGGASEVVAIDSSGPALAAAARSATENGLSERIRWVEADAPAELARATGFDLVVCDPPKLAPARGARQRAGDALRRIAAAAHGAAREGGLVVLSSCSAALGPTELTRAVALGARDAGRRALVWERLSQGPDHPVPAAFPEGLYLSTVIAESLAV